jgi:hypothetical protein
VEEVGTVLKFAMTRLKNVSGVFRAAFLSLLMAALALAQENAPARPCEELVSSIVLQFSGAAPYSELPRIEIRRCDRMHSGILQIVGWEKTAPTPAFIAETTDFTLTQFAMLGGVTLIETSGGTTDRVYIVRFNAGKLKLEAERTTKDRAGLSTNGQSVQVFVPNAWTGKVERLVYPLR